MSTITREWLQQKIADMEASRDEIPFGLDEDDSNTLAAMKLALASLEAEAVAYIFKHPAGRLFWALTDESNKGQSDVMPVYTAPPAPANSEPVAWLWSHRKHPREVSLVRPEDDERAEGAHWSGWSCQALYAAPPAPVSVPDGYRLQPISEYDAMCAAMLQSADGNSPVIPDGWKLVPVELAPEQIRAVQLNSELGAYAAANLTGAYSLFREFWDVAIAAAPQQEVKP